MTLKPNTRRPLAVEALEDRTCMTATAWVASDGHTLKIRGSNVGEEVWITQNDANDTLTIACLFSGPTTPGGPIPIIAPLVVKSSDITRVIVDLKGGDDSFRWGLEGDMTHEKRIELNLGKGADRAFFDFAGPIMTIQGGVDGESGPVSPATIDANLTIAFNAGGGRDQVEALFGNVAEGNQVVYIGQLGTAADQANVVTHGVIAKDALLAVGLFGGTGDDTMAMSTASAAGVDEDGILSCMLAGEDGNDTITQTFDGALNGMGFTLLSGGAGRDTISLTHRSDWSSTGELTAETRGGLGSDNMTLLAGVTPPPPEVQFIQPWTPGVTYELRVTGGQGNDRAETMEGVTPTSVETKVFRTPAWLFAAEVV